MTENKDPPPPSPTSALSLSSDEEQSEEALSSLSAHEEESREESFVTTTTTLSASEQNNNNNDDDAHDQEGPTEEDTASSNEDHSRTNETDENQFEVGDHVYSWCSVWGIPYAYQHHGIVIDRDHFKATVTILDFSCLVESNSETEEETTTTTTTASSGSFRTPRSSYHASASSEGIDGDNNADCDAYACAHANSIVREYTIDAAHAGTVWKKVRYGASWNQRLFRRAGTTSGIVSDPVEIVLARAEFLTKRHRAVLLSSYDLFQSNCEHVAVWCKTGRFCSLQLGAALHKSVALSTVPTVIVSQATTTIPAAGLWGWLGYTTTVSLAATLPWLIPVSILGPAAVAGTSAFNRKRWRQTTERLNRSFEDREKTVMYRVTVLEDDETAGYEKKFVPV